VLGENTAKSDQKTSRLRAIRPSYFQWLGQSGPSRDPLHCPQSADCSLDCGGPETL